jgi:hypothetical protein
MQAIERFIEFSFGEVGIFIASQLDMRERMSKLLMAEAALTILVTSTP